MFDKGKVEKNEDKFAALYTNLSTHLKASDISYNTGDAFYKEFSGFISRLSTTFESLQNNYTQTATTYARTQEEVASKAKKDADFSKDADEFIRGKTEDQVKKNKHLDETKAKVKEHLAQVNAKNLAKIKVKGNENLTRFFETFFRFFYRESKETFDWTKFKDEAIVKDKLDDFQSRLVNFEFGKVSQEQITELVNVKEDPFIKDFVSTKKEGEPVLNLVNYLEYVPELAKVQRELQALVDEIARIKRDTPKRIENAKVEAAQAELLKQNLTHLEAVNARILKGAEPFAEEVRKTDEMIKTYDQHKKHLKTVIHQEYAKVRQVPSGVYQGGDQ